MAATQTKGTHRRDQALLALREKQPCTAADIGEQTGYMWDLEQLGLVQKAGTAPSPSGRGRPVGTYKLASKGTKRASSLAKKLAA